MPRPFTRFGPMSSSSETLVRPGYDTQVTLYGNYITSSYSSTQESVKTPGFRSVKRRSLPINPYSTTVLRREIIPASAIKPNAFGYPTWYQTFDGNPGIRWSDVSDGEQRAQVPASAKIAVESQAVNRCLNELKGMKVNLAQSFAERKQTAGLLMNSVNRLIEFARNFRKGNLAKCLQLLQSWRVAKRQGRQWTDQRWRNIKLPTHNEFSNLWLEYSYGWRPLLADIYGAAELLADTYYRETPPHVAQGTAHQKSTEFFKGQYHTTQVDWDYRIKYKVYFRVDDAALKAGQSTGLTDPLLLAWELIPYSFVVDWVLPVGNYLQGINASAGLVFQKGAKTVKETRSSSVSLRGKDDYGWFIRSGGAKFFVSGFSRSRLTSFPTSSPPSLSLGLNVSQTISGLALLNQIFKPSKTQRVK